MRRRQFRLSFAIANASWPRQASLGAAAVACIAEATKLIKMIAWLVRFPLAFGDGAGRPPTAPTAIAVCRSDVPTAPDLAPKPAHRQSVLWDSLTGQIGDLVRRLRIGGGPRARPFVLDSHMGLH